MIRVVLIGLAFFLGLFSPLAAESTNTLRIGLITPPPHKWTKTAATISKEIEASTDGELSLAVFPSGQLGNEAQMLQLLQTGALDFAFLTTAELANRLIEYSAFYTPYMAKDAAHAACILRSDTANEILASSSKIGVTGLGFGMAGMRQIVSRKPIRTIEDLKGLKVRVTADMPLTDFWRLAGSAPTGIPLSALYDAFANGQVDAMHIDFENTLRLKFYQHAEAVLHSDHMIFPMAALASTRAWRSLSNEHQNTLRGIFTEHLDNLLNSYALADKGFKATLKQEGVSVTNISADFFEPAAKAWTERWQDRTPYIDALYKEAQKSAPLAGCKNVGGE